MSLSSLEATLLSSHTPIDVVFTWVDNQDKDWQTKYHFFIKIIYRTQDYMPKIDVNILIDFINQAKKHENWTLLEQRIEKLFTLTNDILIDKQDYQDDYLLALYHQDKLLTMLNYILDNQPSNANKWLEKIDDNIHEGNLNIQEFIRQKELDCADVVQKFITTT